MVSISIHYQDIVTASGFRGISGVLPGHLCDEIELNYVVFMVNRAFSVYIFFIAATSGRLLDSRAAD